MAIETFTWATQNGEAPDITYRVRTSQFGDGYKQEVGDGINNKSQSWPVNFTGQKGRIREIMAFIDRHKGAKAFLWAPPLGDLGLYKCNGYKPAHRGGQMYAITTTFEQAFHP